MSVAVHVTDDGSLWTCDWGVIEHPSPLFYHGPAGPLMVVTRDLIAKIASDPLAKHTFNDVFADVISEGDRKFLRLTIPEGAWTWELFDAHWWDNDTSSGEIYVGRWPD